MFKRAFIRGILAIAPIVITLAILYWLYELIEGFVGGLYIKAFGLKYYFPGLGLLITLVFIFIIGVLINNWLIKKVYVAFEKLLDKVPLVKTLYGSITDLMGFFKGNSSMANSRVVMVKYGESKIMGIVSRETFEDLPKGIAGENEVAVYIPMSYQIGGFTFMVPKSLLSPVEMGIEEALRFTATAAMPRPKPEEANAHETKKN